MADILRPAGRAFALAMLLIVSAAMAAPPTTAPEPDGPRVICAGGSEAFILDLAAAEHGTIKKLWTWSAANDDGVPAERKKWFGNLDDCKPIDGGRRLLLCASNSGCALIDRTAGKLVWSASVTNAHSIEMLPGERVAVASSLSGDHVVLFDLAARTPEQPVWKTPLHSAHGLVWDDARQTLWTLSFDELRAYTLADWKTPTPALTLKATHHLPNDDGHDLRPVPGSADLLLTTKDGVWLFDRDAGQFRPHPSAGKMAEVKAIDVDPATGRIVYSTWGPAVKLLGPETVIALKGNTVYKVRWFGADGRPK